jgi:hypothetical protein
MQAPSDTCVHLAGTCAALLPWSPRSFAREYFVDFLLVHNLQACKDVKLLRIARKDALQQTEETLCSRRKRRFAADVRDALQQT